MQELGLNEENMQEVVVDEKDLPEESKRWMAIARVNTPKSYSQYSFYSTMRVTWDLAQEIEIRQLDENLYTLKVQCLGDWERVMEEGPWSFKGKAVVMAPYDEFTRPSTIVLDKLEIWAQIHDFLEGYFPLIKSLAATIGEFVFAEPKSQDFEGNFFRVRVKINVKEPLKNVVSLVKNRKREIFRVKYERLPHWCVVCGHLGHLHKECGHGVHPPKALVFKDLRVAWFMGPGRRPGEGRAGTGTRNQGGRGNGCFCRGGRGPEQNYDDSFVQTDGADADMEDVDMNRKRGTLANTSLLTTPGVTPSSQGDVSMLSDTLVPASPSSKHEPKRSKPTLSTAEKNQGKNKAANTQIDARLAGPHSGSRLAH
ncbi:hypothetical protein ZWY2020_037988 [Hordeum vulgare]|nr:hypothetical protein ZWY2020_037988 [Hordeum vulgare]